MFGGVCGAGQIAQAGWTQKRRGRAVFRQPDDGERPYKGQKDLIPEGKPYSADATEQHRAQAARSHMMGRQLLPGTPEQDDRFDADGDRQGRHQDQQQLAGHAALAKEGQVCKGAENGDVGSEGQEVAGDGAARARQEIDRGLRFQGERILGARAATRARLKRSREVGNQARPKRRLGNRARHSAEPGWGAHAGPTLA